MPPLQNEDTMNDETLRQMDEATWKGYITRAIEEIDRKLAAIDEKQDNGVEAISKLRERTAKISGTVAIIVSIIGTFIGAVFKNIIGIK